jgi:hypothetical protein
MTLVGVAAAAVGCSSPAGNLPTSPSEAPATLADHGGTGGNARYYGATFTEGSSVGPGATSTFAITIENCNGSGTCDNSHVTFSTQKIGHATIKIPDGFTGVTILGVTNSQSTDAWQGSPFSDSTGSYIRLAAPAGNKRLEPGQSVTVRFSATAPCEGGEYDWDTEAYQDTDVADNDTPYVIVGDEPSMTVTGDCITECTVRGQGYWEHHFSDWPAIGTGLMLGNRLYTPAELLSILQQNPVAGNGLIALAHQLVSAKLNIANGANSSSITSTIAAADALIANQVVPPVGSGSLAPSQTGALTQALDDFNSQCED